MQHKNSDCFNFSLALYFSVTALKIKRSTETEDINEKKTQKLLITQNILRHNGIVYSNLSLIFKRFPLLFQLY